MRPPTRSSRSKTALVVRVHAARRALVERALSFPTTARQLGGTDVTAVIVDDPECEHVIRIVRTRGAPRPVRDALGRYLAERNACVLANQGLVHMVALRGHKFVGASLEDRMQDGQAGLIRAIALFDPGRNVQFSTYAIPWIRNAIWRAHDNTAHLVRMSVASIDRRRIILRAVTQCGSEEPAKIAAYLQEHFGEHCRIKALRGQRMLDAIEAALLPIPPIVGMEHVSLPESAAQDGAVELVDEIDRVMSTIEKLPRLQQHILRRRFGLGGDDERTLGEIGDELGLSRERIRQLETEALRKMRAMLAQRPRAQTSGVLSDAAIDVNDYDVMTHGQRQIRIRRWLAGKVARGPILLAQAVRDLHRMGLSERALKKHIHGWHEFRVFKTARNKRLLWVASATAPVLPDEIPLPPADVS